MRPKQWVKNFFVLAPLLFTGQFNQQEAVFNVACAFVLFCLASSATYIVNDLRDIERDRAHPVKSKKRPLASGALTIKRAGSLLVFLYCVLGASAFIFPKVMLVIGVYLLLNMAYSFGLKNQPVG